MEKRAVGKAGAKFAVIHALEVTGDVGAQGEDAVAAEILDFFRTCLC